MGPDGTTTQGLPPPTTAGVPRPRRRWVCVGLLLVAGLFAAVGWAWWLPPVPPVPAVDLSQAEPPVTAAVEAARSEVTRAPRTAAGWGRCGQVFLVHEFNAQAAECFAVARRLDPAEPRWPYFLGGLRRLTDPPAAVPLLREAADGCDRVCPDNSAPRLLLSELFLTLGQVADAADGFTAVLRHDPGNLRAELGLATVAVQTGDLAGGRERLLRCLSSQFTRRKASAQLARLCAGLGDAESAEMYARWAVAEPVDADWPDPFTTESLRLAAGSRPLKRLAERLDAEGRPADALALYAKLVEETGDYRAAVSQGCLLGKMNRFREAEVVFRRAIKAEPDRMQAYYFLSVILVGYAHDLAGAGGGRAEIRRLAGEATDAATRAVALKPDHALAHMYRGKALLFLGRDEEGLAALRAAVGCSPEVPDPYLELGAALARRNRRAEAREWLELATRLSAPTDRHAREALEALDRAERPGDRQEKMRNEPRP